MCDCARVRPRLRSRRAAQMAARFVARAIYASGGYDRRLKCKADCDEEDWDDLLEHLKKQQACVI